MKTLHDNAPQSEISELYKTIEEDLNCKVTQLKQNCLSCEIEFILFFLLRMLFCSHFKMSDIFKEIDSKPIGTASLAQCHKAVLHDGTVVAVKVQHPRVKANSFTDIKTMLVCIQIFYLFYSFSFYLAILNSC